MHQPHTVDTGSDVLAYVTIRRTHDASRPVTATSACTGMDRPDFARVLARLADHYAHPADEPDGSTQP